MFNIATSDYGPLQILVLTGHFLLAILYAVIMNYVIKRTSTIIGDKSQYTIMFPLLIPTMVLIIFIIKSSLALSLGLVGALSIVRFRTPIKDPEELVYIFIAIAIGLGIGAGKIVVTTISFVILISTLFVISIYRKQRIQMQGIYIDIEAQLNTAKQKMTGFKKIFDSHHLRFDLKRYEEDKNRLSSTFYVEAADLDMLEKIVGEIKSAYKDANVTVVNSTQNI